MDCWKNQLFEIDDCLYNFNVKNLYDAAVNLFKVLKFPVNELDEDTRNLTIEEFLRNQGESEDYINPSEELAVSLIEKVSILFILNSQTKGLEYVEEYDDEIYVGASIIVIGVELFESNYSEFEVKENEVEEEAEVEKEDKDNNYIIPAITTFFNRLINTQILILFKKGSKIAFSVKRRRINKIDNTRDAKGSNFQTEWIQTLPPSEETVFKVLDFSFDNFRDGNFHLMYNDMVKFVAVDYLIEDFPENDNISSHLVLTDGVALYLRDSRNLAYNRFDFRPKNDESELDGQEDIQYSNGAEETPNNFIDEAAMAAEEVCLDFENEFLLRDLEYSEEGDKIDDTEKDLLLNNNDETSSLIDEELFDSQDGDQIVDEIVKNIIGDFSNLKNNFSRLSDFFNEHRKDDKNLSIKEIKELSDYCIKKMEEIEVFLSDVDSLWDRFDSMVQGDDVSSANEGGKEYSENIAYTSNDSSASNDDLQSYSFTNPYKITLLNVDYEVRNWTDVLLTVCEALIKVYPEQVSVFDKNPILRGRSRQYFSYEKELLTDHAKELSNGLFVETNFSADDIVRHCKQILSICGLTSSDISFYVNKRPKVEHLEFTNDGNISEVKFPQTYGSITVSEELLKLIFSTISEYCNKELLYIDYSDLKDELYETIQSLSSYSRPEHVLQNVLRFLLDWGIVAFYEGAKRKKYVIKDKSILDEIISDPRAINEFFRSE
ncbi:MAG TPA: hypothetical protein GXX18_09465 [Bacillales bacterium]|nr:hypothetical protein [Bacillales bacterium]